MRSRLLETPLRWHHRSREVQSEVIDCGGWKNTQTLTDLYDIPDRETLEEVAMGGQDLGAIER